MAGRGQGEKPPLYKAIITVRQLRIRLMKLVLEIEELDNALLLSEIPDPLTCRIDSLYSDFRNELKQRREYLAALEKRRAAYNKKVGRT